LMKARNGWEERQRERYRRGKRVRENHFGAKKIDSLLHDLDGRLDHRVVTHKGEKDVLRVASLSIDHKGAVGGS
jgi:hypothetical protein